MRIFIISSKVFYDRIPEIKKKLEETGHIITLPNCFDDPGTEARMRGLGRSEHANFKSEMIKKSEKEIEDQDAVLVLNFEKNGIQNYIGGATFLEMYDAFRLNKKIFLWNEIPEGILKDEIIGFKPVIINSDITKII